MAVDTRKITERRTVSYRCIGCLKKDLDAIEAAHRAGTLRAVGNWTPGQILQHCSKLMRFALDGFPFRLPWFLRTVGRIIRTKALAPDTRLPGPGLKLGGPAAAQLPDPDVSFEDGMRALREQIARIDRGEQMTHPSPLFGPLTHEQWMHLHLRHCMLHLSFLSLRG